MALIRKDAPEVTNPGVSTFHTILGPEANFEGTLTFQGSVRIEGNFSGKVITNDRLMIVEGAEVKAEVEAGSLELSGTLRGNVKAKRQVVLMAPAHMYGNIETPSLVIHEGVIFEGGCRMENLDKPSVLTNGKSSGKGTSESKPADGKEKTGGDKATA